MKNTLVTSGPLFEFVLLIVVDYNTSSRLVVFGRDCAVIGTVSKIFMSQTSFEVS